MTLTMTVIRNTAHLIYATVQHIYLSLYSSNKVSLITLLHILQIKKPRHEDMKSFAKGQLA